MGKDYGICSTSDWLALDLNTEQYLGQQIQHDCDCLLLLLQQAIQQKHSLCNDRATFYFKPALEIRTVLLTTYFIGDELQLGPVTYNLKLNKTDKRWDDCWRN